MNKKSKKTGTKKSKRFYNVWFKTVTVILLNIFILNTVAWSCPVDLCPAQMKLATQNPSNPFFARIKHEQLIKYYINCLKDSLKLGKDASKIRGPITDRVLYDDISVTVDLFSEEEDAQVKKLLEDKKDSYIVPCRVGSYRYYAFVTVSDEETFPMTSVFSEKEFKEVLKEGEISHKGEPRKVKPLKEAAGAGTGYGRIGNFVRTSEINTYNLDTETFEGVISFDAYSLDDPEQKEGKVEIKVEKNPIEAFMGYKTTATRLPGGRKDTKGVFERMGMFMEVFYRLHQEVKNLEKLRKKFEITPEAMGDLLEKKKISERSSLIFEKIKNTVDEVYGEYGLSALDLKRTYMRAFYYWETRRYLEIEQGFKKDKTHMPETPEASVDKVKSWLQDEIRVADMFGQAVGSRANYGFVRDLTQGHRLTEISDYVKKRGIQNITRDDFLYEMRDALSVETELLLIRMAQIEAERNIPEHKRIAGRLQNGILKLSIEETYVKRPYKLTVRDPKRKTMRMGKLWGGLKGLFGMGSYLGITGETAAEQGIEEAEQILGAEGEKFTGEDLVYFPNEQMPSLECLNGIKGGVSDYHLSLLFGHQFAGNWLYERFDGYMPYTIKYLIASIAAISDQIHLSSGLHGKPETFIMLAVHPEYGAAIFGFKKEATNEQIVNALTKVHNKEPGAAEEILKIANVLEARKGQLKPKDVINVLGETRHTVGGVRSLELSDEEFEKLINHGTVNMLEIAYNQFAVSKYWVDPATKRIADFWVDRVKKILAKAAAKTGKVVDVVARHIDTELVRSIAAKLKKYSPEESLKKPDELKGAEQIHKIGSHYDFSIIDFKKAGEKHIIDHFGKGHTIFMAQGVQDDPGKKWYKVTDELERTRLIFKPEQGAESSITLRRGEGVRIPVTFKGKIEVEALDKGAWGVWVTVPKSERPEETENDLFVRKGVQFETRPPVPGGTFLPAPEGPKDFSKVHRSRKKGASAADYLASLGEAENADMQEGHTINSYMDRVKPDVSRRSISEAVRTNVERGLLIEKPVPGAGRKKTYEVTDKGRERLKLINSVKAKADKAAHGIVNALVNLALDMDKDEKMLFAINNNLHREGTELLIQNVIKDICALSDDPEVKKLLHKFVFVYGKGEGLKGEVQKYLTGENDEKIKVKLSNVIVLTEDADADIYEDYEDDATITFVNDDLLNIMDYYPLAELAFFTLAKVLYHRQVEEFMDERKLVDIFRSFKSETLDEEEIIEICIKQKICNIVLRPSEPFDYDEQINIYESIQEFFRAA